MKKVFAQMGYNCEKNFRKMLRSEEILERRSQTIQFKSIRTGETKARFPSRSFLHKLD